MKEPPGLVVDLGALQVEGYAGRGVGRYAAGHVQALAWPPTTRMVPVAAGR